MSVSIPDIWVFIQITETLKLIGGKSEWSTGAKVSYPILNVKLAFENGETRTFEALNEATIKRSDRTMVVDVVINNVHFEHVFRGDGISVSAYWKHSLQ